MLGLLNWGQVTAIGTRTTSATGLPCFAAIRVRTK